MLLCTAWTSSRGQQRELWAESQEPGAAAEVTVSMLRAESHNREPRAAMSMPRAENRGPGAKSQEPWSREPRAKSRGGVSRERRT